MKYTILIICIGLFCSCSLYDANEDDVIRTLYEKYDKRLLDYNAVSKQNKQMVWHEEFDNNDSKWPVDILTNPRYAIIDGCLISSNHSISFLHSHQIPVLLEQSKNYEIEINCDASNGQIISLHNPNSVQNGTIPVSQIYLIMLQYIDNKYSIAFGNGLWEIYSSNQFWLPNQLNTITIRKIEDKFSFFVNSIFFHILDKKDFKGQAVMIWVNNSSIFDYVRVQYIQD